MLKRFSPMYFLPIFQKKKIQLRNLKNDWKSKFKQTNYFCNCLSRNTLLVCENSVNLLALGIKRVTRNSPTFLP